LNFRIYLLSFLLFPLCSCGVKSPPISPPGSGLPSYTDQFLDLEAQKKEAEIEAAKAAAKKKDKPDQTKYESQ